MLHSHGELNAPCRPHAAFQWRQGIGLQPLAVLLMLLGCAGRDGTPEDTGTPVQPPDSATAVRATLDTLGRLGARDLVIDSLARHGDTVTVWMGPPNRMITDRPATGVSVVRPARVVGVRLVPGGE